MSFEYRVKVVGSNPESVKSIQELVDKGLEAVVPDFSGELKKTEEETRLINYGLETARSFLEKKLNIQRPPFPISRIILAPSAVLREAKGGVCADTIKKQIFLERTNSDLELVLSVAHEWLHLASPTVAYINQLHSTDTTPALIPWRHGINAIKNSKNAMRDPNILKAYEGLEKLSEAIIGRTTRLLYFDSFFKNPQFAKEIQACARIKDYLRADLPLIKAVIETELSDQEVASFRSFIGNLKNLIVFRNWQTILENIKDAKMAKDEVLENIINGILSEQLVPLEGHPEQQDYLDEVLQSIFSHNVAQGSKVREVKTMDGAFWLLAQAEYSGRLLPLARKLRLITNKKDFFKKIAEGVVPKV